MKWFSAEVGGQTWHVYVVPPEHPDLHEDDEWVRAATYPERCLVVISSDLSPDAREMLAWHELMEHAVNDVSGASHEMGEQCADGTEHDVFEERLVRARTPIAWTLAKSLGFRFPKGPNE